MNLDLKLTDIRLGTDHDVEDAISLATQFLAFNPDAENSDLYQCSHDLFAASALQLICRGDATIKDVLDYATDLSRNPVLQMPHFFTTDQKSTAAGAWLFKFNRMLGGIPTDEAATRLVMRCHAQWQIALRDYEAARKDHVTRLLATSDIPDPAAIPAPIRTVQTAPGMDMPGPADWAQPHHKHPAFAKILQLAAARKNILLVGPAGTGKTHAAQQAARELGLEFASISVTAGMSVSQLTGWLMPGGYLESDFVRLYENGGVFLLDEMDAADANTLTIINQALANGSFNIAQRTGKSEIKKHPNFVCIAAANTFGTGADMIYAGREQLDAATLDRFMNVYVDYDRHFEQKRCDREVLAFAHAVRDAILKLKLRRVMSTRKAIDLSDMKRGPAGWTLAECKECYFTGWSVDEKAKLQSYVG